MERTYKRLFPTVPITVATNFVCRFVLPDGIPVRHYTGPGLLAPGCQSVITVKAKVNGVEVEEKLDAVIVEPHVGRMLVAGGYHVRDMPAEATPWTAIATKVKRPPIPSLKVLEGIWGYICYGYRPTIAPTGHPASLAIILACLYGTGGTNEVSDFIARQQALGATIEADGVFLVYHEATDETEMTSVIAPYLELAKGTFTQDTVVFQLMMFGLGAQKVAREAASWPGYMDARLKGYLNTLGMAAERANVGTSMAKERPESYPALLVDYPSLDRYVLRGLVAASEGSRTGLAYVRAITRGYGMTGYRMIQEFIEAGHSKPTRLHTYKDVWQDVVKFSASLRALVDTLGRDQIPYLFLNHGDQYTRTNQWPSLYTAAQVAKLCDTPTYLGFTGDMTRVFVNYSTMYSIKLTAKQHVEESATLAKVEAVFGLTLTNEDQLTRTELNQEETISHKAILAEYERRPVHRR